MGSGSWLVGSREWGVVGCGLVGCGETQMANVNLTFQREITQGKELPLFQPRISRITRICQLLGCGLPSGFHPIRSYRRGNQIVAHSTCKPQIHFLIRSATTHRNQMLDFEFAKNKMLRAETIAAPVFGNRANVSLDLILRFRLHGLGGCRRPRRTLGGRGERSGCAHSPA